MYADRFKYQATIGAGVISSIATGASISGFRTPAQVITDGASNPNSIKVGKTGVPFLVSDSAGNWERGYYTITSATQITKTSVIASSNGGAAVSFAAGTVTVLNDPPEDWAQKVVTTDMGVNITDLAAFSGTPSDTCVIPIQDPSTGLTYKIGIAALKTLFAGAPAATIGVNNPGAQVASVAFTVAGTYANGTPTALDWSINGGATWNAAVSPTISGGTFSFAGVTVPSANASQTIMVRDHNSTSVIGISSTFAVSAPETLTVNTPTTQTVGVPFTVTGTYANGTPAALDYRLSDDTAGQWTAAPSPTISGGNFSFSITPSTTNAARTISVRDHNNTGVTSTSGTYAVNSAPPTVTGVAVTPSAPTVNGGQTQQFSATVSGTNSPSQAVTWSVSAGVGSINSNGLYTAPAAAGSQQTATVKAISQQDGSTYGTATVTIPAAAQTITVNNPGTQNVNTPYTLSGTWTVVQPTALDFQTTDNGGTPSAWTAASSGLVINANGTWQFTVTPSSSSTSRIISVRDHTTLVSGSSTAYVVNAPSMASLYNLTATNSAGMTGGNLTMTFTSPDYYAAPANTRVNIRSNDGNNTVPTDGTFKWVWVKKGQPVPTTFSSTSVPAGSVNGNQTTHTNSIAGNFSHLGSWTNSSSPYYGTYDAGSFYIWGTPGTYNLWVMFSDGSMKVYDNGTGTAIDYVCS